MGLEHKEYTYKILFVDNTERIITKGEYECFRDQIVTNSSRWLYLQDSPYNTEIKWVLIASIKSVSVTINNQVKKGHRRFRKFKWKRLKGVRVFN